MSPKRWPLGSQDQRNPPQLFPFLHDYKGHCWGALLIIWIRTNWGRVGRSPWSIICFPLPLLLFCFITQPAKQNKQPVTALQRKTLDFSTAYAPELLLLLSISLTHFFQNRKRALQKFKYHFSPPFCFAPTPPPSPSLPASSFWKLHEFRGLLVDLSWTSLIWFLLYANALAASVCVLECTKRFLYNFSQYSADCQLSGRCAMLNGA